MSLTAPTSAASTSFVPKWNEREFPSYEDVVCSEGTEGVKIRPRSKISVGDDWWYARFRMAENYLNAFGELPPRGFRFVHLYSGVAIRLGAWMTNQRAYCANGLLPSGLVLMLHKLPGFFINIRVNPGVISQPIGPQFWWNVDIVKSFVEHNGHLPHNKYCCRYLATGENVRVGQWVKQQRRSYICGMMDRGQFETLNEIPGFFAKCYARSTRVAVGTQLAQNIKIIKAYMSTHDGTIPPHRSKHTCPDTGTVINIGQWISRQRSDFRGGRMSPDRFAALNSIQGFFKNDLP